MNSTKNKKNWGYSKEGIWILLQMKETALLYDPNHIYKESFTLSDEKKL